MARQFYAQLHGLVESEEGTQSRTRPTSQDVASRYSDHDQDVPANSHPSSAEMLSISSDEAHADILSISSDGEEQEAVDLPLEDAIKSEGHTTDDELPLPPSNQHVLHQSRPDPLQASSSSSSLFSATRYSMSESRLKMRAKKAKRSVAYLRYPVRVDSITHGLVRSPSRPVYFFPRNAPSAIHQLTYRLRVLEEMHCALLSKRLVTKRDIYYRAAALFGSQAVVDRIIDEVSCQMGLRRSALGVAAASKGLIAGGGTIRLLQKPPLKAQGVNSSLSGLSHEQENLLPAVDDVARIESEGLWVLVVEKEAVFNTLVKARITKAFSKTVGQGLLITGKGYPDLITREFLTRLWGDNPHVTIFVMVDHDPFGLHIFQQYIKALPPHANLRLIGLRASDLQNLPATTDRDFLPLKHADRVRAEKMLAQQGLDLIIKHELQEILLTGRKAEIEIISIAGRRRRMEQGGPGSQGREEKEEGEERDSLVDYVEERLSSMLKDIHSSRREDGKSSGMLH